LRDALARTLEARHAHTGVRLTVDAARLAQIVLALAQGLAFESLADADAVDPALFGDALALIYDGLVVRAERAAAKGRGKSAR
jgi:F0F1-type ATP synthase membrane subunit c/vacuolar-type H+-ATPase subunit K